MISLPKSNSTGGQGSKNEAQVGQCIVNICAVVVVTCSDSPFDLLIIVPHFLNIQFFSVINIVSFLVRNMKLFFKLFIVGNWGC